MKKLLTLTLSQMLGIAAFAQGPFPTFTNQTHTAEAQPFADLSQQIWDLMAAKAPAPRQKKAAPFRLPGLRKSREDYTSAASFFLSETELSWGSSVSVLDDVRIRIRPFFRERTRGSSPCPFLVSVSGARV